MRASGVWWRMEGSSSRPGTCPVGHRSWSPQLARRRGSSWRRGTARTEPLPGCERAGQALCGRGGECGSAPGDDRGGGLVHVQGRVRRDPPGRQARSRAGTRQVDAGRMASIWRGRGGSGSRRGRRQAGSQTQPPLPRLAAPSSCPPRAGPRSRTGDLGPAPSCGRPCGGPPSAPCEADLIAVKVREISTRPRQSPSRGDRAHQPARPRLLRPCHQGCRRGRTEPRLGQEVTEKPALKTPPCPAGGSPPATPTSCDPQLRPPRPGSARAGRAAPAHAL